MASHKSLYFARQSFPDSIDSDVAENTCRLPQASTTRPELKSERRTVLHRSRWSHHSDDHTIWQGQIARRLRRMFFFENAKSGSGFLGPSSCKLGLHSLLLFKKFISMKGDAHKPKVLWRRGLCNNAKQLPDIPGFQKWNDEKYG